MWKVLTVLVQATILFLSISASAQTTPDAQAILKKVNETYRNLKSYQFEYKTVYDSKTERGGLTSTTHHENLSRITAVRPDRIHVETQGAFSSVLFIADGQNVWLSTSELNVYTKRAAGTVDIFAAAKSTDSHYEKTARGVNAKLAEYARLTSELHNLTLLPNETITFEGRQMNWIGQAAPDFTLTDLNGKTVSSQSLRGKVVLLNFWATWCGPCVAEMPHLEKLHREYKNKGVIILGIDDEGAEVAQDFLKRHGYTFNTLIDAEKQVSKLYRINAIPQSFFITKDGKIAAYHRGSRRESELRAGIEKALAGKIEEPALKVAGVQAEPKLDPAALPAPILVSPEHLSHFDHYPRTTVLVWKAVPGAAGYRVETDFQFGQRIVGLPISGDP